MKFWCRKTKILLSCFLQCRLTVHFQHVFHRVMMNLLLGCSTALLNMMQKYTSTAQALQMKDVWIHQRLGVNVQGTESSKICFSSIKTTLIAGTVHLKALWKSSHVTSQLRSVHWQPTEDIVTFRTHQDWLIIYLKPWVTF